MGMIGGNPPPGDAATAPKSAIAAELSDPFHVMITIPGLSAECHVRPQAILWRGPLQDTGLARKPMHSTQMHSDDDSSGELLPGTALLHGE